MHGNLEIVATQDREKVVELLSEMAPDDRVDLLNEVEPSLADALVEQLPKEERRETLAAAGLSGRNGGGGDDDGSREARPNR